MTPPAEKRFPFGKNWLAFLSTIDDARVAEAENSLLEMLGLDTLRGLTFLDAGSGSGLFSLAARRLGATVRSFDVDPSSVACTEELRRRYVPDDARWTISEGSVMDKDFLNTLGTYDIVYSWGVLHHTGSMWRSLENILPLVTPGGQLFISLYNDQGLRSHLWRMVKATYCTGTVGKWLVTAVFVPLMFLRSLAAGTVKYGNPLAQMMNYRENRGMSIYYDWIDWLGGYPYEVAAPAEVRKFFGGRCFQETASLTVKGHGCNQFVFRKK